MYNFHKYLTKYMKTGYFMLMSKTCYVSVWSSRKVTYVGLCNISTSCILYVNM